MCLVSVGVDYMVNLSWMDMLEGKFYWCSIENII